MQPEKCMYLHLVEADSTALDLVLSSQDEDYQDKNKKKWPGKFAMVEEKVVDDPAQQWYWNENDGSMRNAANPDYRLDTITGWLYLANLKKSDEGGEGFPSTPRKWFYDSVNSALTTELFEDYQVQAAIWGQPSKWSWVEVGPTERLKESPSSQWRIEYC